MLEQIVNLERGLDERVTRAFIFFTEGPAWKRMAYPHGGQWNRSQQRRCAHGFWVEIRDETKGDLSPR